VTPDAVRSRRRPPSAAPAAYHLDELAIALDPTRPGHLLPEVRPHHRRVLDVGCGAGQTLVGCGLHRPEASAEAWGVDLDTAAIAVGLPHWPCLRLLTARGESLPFPDASFDLVLSRVALPYMDIPAALGEFARVLRPGGELWLALHPARLVVRQLAAAARAGAWRSMAYQLYVLANGAAFHLTGVTRPFPLAARGTESWQSRRGMRTALRRAGLTDVVTTRHDGTLAMTARRPRAADGG
jgi:SAM-dependent methyltransferase